MTTAFAPNALVAWLRELGLAGVEGAGRPARVTLTKSGEYWASGLPSNLDPEHLLAGEIPPEVLAQDGQAPLPVRPELTTPAADDVLAVFRAVRSSATMCSRRTSCAWSMRRSTRRKENGSSCSRACPEREKPRWPGRTRGLTAKFSVCRSSLITCRSPFGQTGPTLRASLVLSTRSARSRHFMRHLHYDFCSRQIKIQTSHTFSAWTK